MPAGKRISLGAAFFGCDPAEGHYSPGQQVPDAWLLLLAKTRDEEVLRGVFSSCKAGRDWCLASAHVATLRLDMSTAEADEQAWGKCLDALQSHLATRGDQGHTVVEITSTREQSTTPAFQQLPGLISAASGAVNFLFFETPEGQQAPDTAALSSFVQQAAPGLGNLCALSVRCGACVVPAPALLPKLEMVDVKLPPGTADSTVAAVLGSIRPYLGQLTNLTVGLAWSAGPLPDSFPWHLLFPPAPPPATTATAAADPTSTAAAPAAAAAATTLTTTATAASGAAATVGTAAASTATATAAMISAAAANTAAAPKLSQFSTTYDLTDTLLTTLLHHAPNLADLQVGRIAIREDYSSREWAVCALEAWFGAWDSGLVRLYEGMYMPTLVRLPGCQVEEVIIFGDDGQLVATSGPLTVGGFRVLKLFATSKEGLDESIRDRLCDFTFNVSEVGIFPARSLPLADQPAAFKSMLQQLSDLDAPDALVVTRGWHWTVDMLKIAAEYVPKLDHLRVQVYVWCEEALTDAYLAHIQQLSDNFFVGHFERLGLQSDQHSNAKWPFLGLTLRNTVNVADLVRLPRPDGTSDAVLWCCKLVIDSRSITEVGVERLCAWLQHVRWTHPDMSLHFWQRMTITLRCPQDDPAMQRAQLQVLRAMHLDTKPDIQAKVTVVLDGWQFTHAAMDALREDLPEWASQIDMSQTTFPLQPSEYARFAECVPVSFITWHTGLQYQSPAYEAVTRGIAARRQGLGLKRLMVTVHSQPGSWVHSVEEHYTVHTQHAADEWGDEVWYEWEV